MTSRKHQLIEAAIDYLLEHGIADLSLRPLAAGIGTSARLLVFHFKSREGLIEDLLGEVQARLQRSFIEIATAESAEPLMKRFWRWATDKRNLPYLRLLYEAHFIAMQNPRAHQGYLARSSRGWVELIAAHLPPSIGSAASATLCGAVFDGLIIELLNTGDLARTTRALDHFIELLQSEHQARSRAASTRSRKRNSRTTT